MRWAPDSLRVTETVKAPTPVEKVTLNAAGAVRTQPGGGAVTPVEDSLRRRELTRTPAAETEATRATRQTGRILFGEPTVL